MSTSQQPSSTTNTISQEDVFQTRITRFLDSLPVKELDTISNESECSIFMEEFGGNIIVIFPCGHYFDKECIREWIERRRTCPMCRSRLSLDDAYDNEMGLRTERANAMARELVRRWVLSINRGGESSRSNGTTTGDDDTISGDAA